jgi:ParB-like chromosome segregation protein Spo0J
MKSKIEYLAVDKLIPYARNSRTHSDEQVAQVAASIREFGFTNPVLVDAESTIIAGHARVMAARKLEMTEVPCIRLTHLTETQKRAYIIADNKLALNAGWDSELLRLELDDLRAADFDLDLIGFDETELDGIAADEEQPFFPDPQYRETKTVFQVTCRAADSDRVKQSLLHMKDDFDEFEFHEKKL